jgi:hypothetical protein
VEPDYEKKLETLDDLLHSDVVYGYHPAINYGQDTVSCPNLMTFLEAKRLQEDCRNIRKYVERIILTRDIASVLAPMFVTYIAREMGTVDVGKMICSFNRSQFLAV